MRENDDRIMDKTLVRERINHQRCPYCGAEREDLNYHAVDCMGCERHFTGVYFFQRVILTDYKGDNFRVDLND